MRVCIPKSRNFGWTLLELLISLSIAAVLTGLALPSFREWIAQERATSAVNTFAGLLATARSSALTHRTTITVCPASGDQCARRNTWQLGTMVFQDRNRNRRLDNGEWLVRRLPAFRHGGLRWRSFRNRSYLRIRSNGLTDFQNGHFQYCPDSNDPRHARMLVLNVAGRVRVTQDLDGDGVREDAQGRPLRCS